MNVATPKKDCLEILYELLVPVLKARSERNLTRQEVSMMTTTTLLELINSPKNISLDSSSSCCKFVDSQKSILLDCETQVERLLAEAFQNYKSLDDNSPTGLADTSAPTSETASPALAPAVQLYTLLHDILAQDAQTMLRNYLKVTL